MANPDVGTRFEVAINDVGYMLAVDPTGEFQYERAVSTIEPQRFASGATPLSEALERYMFFNSSEWRGGSGQRFLNRESSDASSFWDSQGIDPFREDQRLALLPDVDLKQASAVADAMVVAGSNYMLLRDTGNVEQHTISGDTPSAGNTHTFTTVTDMDIGYGKGFVATGTDLQEITLGSAGDPQLSALDVHRVAWIGDRLAVLYRDSGTSTWRFSTLDTAGTEEATGGLLTLPGATNAAMSSCEYRLGGITDGIGYVWFSGWTQDGDEGYIYLWNIDTTSSPSIAMRMPRGEVPLDIFYYQNGLYIWAVANNSAKVKIYRCVVNGDGTLTPFLIVEDAGTAPSDTNRDGRKFAADGRYIYFAWNDMQTNGGFGVIDLATGGYAKRGHGTATGDVVSVFVWGNRPGLSVASRGAMLEHSSDLVTTGYLSTSIADADSALDKHWDTISFSGDQATGTDVSVAYTVDGGTSYTGLIANSVLSELTADLDVDSVSLGMKMTLVGNGSTTPLLRVTSAKFHALGLGEEILVLPIDCSDRVEGLNGQLIASTNDSGRARARTLQGLRGNFVNVQDVDYKETTTVTSMEVLQVRVRGFVAASDPSTGTNRSRQVAMVTLRRDLGTTATSPPAANTAPVLTAIGVQSDTIDVPLALSTPATDANSDNLVWGAKGLPTGLVMLYGGTVSGTPTVAGVFSTTITVSDPNGGSDSETLNWTIS